MLFLDINLKKSLLYLMVEFDSLYNYFVLIILIGRKNHEKEALVENSSNCFIDNNN
jgi:hypothetical protein